MSWAGSDCNSRPVFSSSSDTQLASVTVLWARQTQGNTDRSLTQANTHPTWDRCAHKHWVLNAFYGRTRLEDIKIKALSNIPLKINYIFITRQHLSISISITPCGILPEQNFQIDEINLILRFHSIKYLLFVLYYFVCLSCAVYCGNKPKLHCL